MSLQFNSIQTHERTIKQLISRIQAFQQVVLSLEHIFDRLERLLDIGFLEKFTFNEPEEASDNIPLNFPRLEDLECMIDIGTLEVTLQVSRFTDIEEQTHFPEPFVFTEKITKYDNLPYMIRPELLSFSYRHSLCIRYEPEQLNPRSFLVYYVS